MPQFDYSGCWTKSTGKFYVKRYINVKFVKLRQITCRQSRNLPALCHEFINNAPDMQITITKKAGNVENKDIEIKINEEIDLYSEYAIIINIKEK